MSSAGVTLVDPLTLGTAIPSTARCNGKIAVLSLLIGFGFAAFLLGDGHPAFEDHGATMLFGRPPAVGPRMAFATPFATPSVCDRMLTVVNARSRAEKEGIVKSMKKAMKESDLVVIVKSVPGSMKPAETQALKVAIEDSGSRLRMMKKTLLKIALDGTKDDSLKEKLGFGHTAVVVNHRGTPNDPVTQAKCIVELEKKLNPKKSDKGFFIQGGSLDGQFLDPAGIVELSKLPSLDESRARIAQLLKAQPGKIARLIKSPITKLGRSIKMGIIDKEEKKEE